jgi:hypothetical protein
MTLPEAGQCYFYLMAVPAIREPMQTESGIHTAIEQTFFLYRVSFLACILGLSFARTREKARKDFE